MNKKLITLALTFICSGAYAQDASLVLTLEDAVSITLDSNETLKSLDFEQKAAKRERQAAIGLFMPKVNIKGGYTYLGKNIDVPFNDLKPGIEQHAAQIVNHFKQSPILGPLLEPLLPTLQSQFATLMGLNWNYTLQDRSTGFIGGDVEMPIFMGGKIIVANKAARLKEKEVGFQADQKRNSLYSELIERYFGYQLALNAVEVRRQVLEGMEHHLKDIKSLEKNGMVAQTERLYVEYKYSEAERELMNAEMNAQTICSALATTLGVENPKTPVSSMFVIENLEPASYFKNLAASSNPLVNQVDIKKQLAKQNVNLNRADFFPQIVAMGGLSFCDYHLTKIVPRWAVGVGFNFKIFDGLRREYKYSAAKNTLQRVENIQAKADKDILLLVESLYSRLMTYRNQLMSIEASLSFAEEYLRAKTAAYKSGMSSSTDMVDAELNLAKAKIERLQAAYNFDVALAKLLEAAGASTEYISYSRRNDARPITFTREK